MVPIVLVTVLEKMISTVPATLYQRLYLSSSLLLPPVESGSSHCSVTVVVVVLITLKLRGGDGGTVCVWGRGD